MMVSMPRPPLHKLPIGAFAAGTKARKSIPAPHEMDDHNPQKAGENVAQPCDLVVTDVVNLQPTHCHVAQDHVGFAKAAEIAQASDLPVQANRAQEGGVDDGVVANVVDHECAGAAIAYHHVAHAVSGSSRIRSTRASWHGKKQTKKLERVVSRIFRTFDLPERHPARMNAPYF